MKTFTVLSGMPINFRIMKKANSFETFLEILYIKGYGNVRILKISFPIWSL
jgi:hypothetical protein